MNRESQWPLGDWRLPVQTRLLSCFVVPLISYSCLMQMFLLTFLFTLMGFLQMPLLTVLNATWSPLEWKTALQWLLPCSEKILWQTHQRQNKETHSVTASSNRKWPLPKSRLPMLVYLLFITILTAGGKENIYNYKYDFEHGQITMHLYCYYYHFSNKTSILFKPIGKIHNFAKFPGYKILR